MGAHADGSIIVDTQLDSEGFKAGSAELKGALKSLSGKLSSLGPMFKKALGGAGSAVGSFKSQTKNLESTISELEIKLKELGSARIPTEDFTALAAEEEKAGLKLEQLLNKQEKLRAMGVDENSAQWKSLAYDLEIASQKYDALAAAKARMQASGTAYTAGSETAQYAQMEAALASARNKLAGMKSEVASTNSFMKRITTSARNFMSTIAQAAKTVGGKLVSGLKSAASNMTRLVTHSKMMKRPLENMSFLLRRIGPSLLMTEGLFGLLRKAVNAFLQENEQLAANLNACWAGIGNILGPIITRLINLVSTAVAYVTQFLALLGFVGKSTTKAISSAGGGAAKETEKLKRQLASFDELNILSDSKEDSGGGGGSDTPTAETPDVTLPDWVKTMVDHLKSGEWSAAATVLTNQLNSMVENVDWAGIGDSLAYWLNAALEFLATAILTFDWYNLGVGLGTSINSLIHNVDWTNLGVVLGAKFIALIGTLGGLFATIDWPGLGKALADGFMGLWNAIDWKQAAKTLSDGIIGALNALSTAIKNVDWRKLGNDVATFVANIDWSGVATALFDGLGAVLGGLTAFLWGLIEDAWAAVVDWWYDVAYEDGQFTMEGLLQGIWDAICNIGTWVVENVVDPFIQGFKDAFGINSPSTVMAELGGFIIEGLLGGITSAWSTITSFFGTALSDLTSSLSSCWSDIKTEASTAWSNVKTSVTDAWSNIKSGASTGYNAVRSGVSSAWSNVKSWTSSTWSDVKQSVSSAWNSVQKNTDKLSSGIESAVSETWENIQEYVNSNLTNTESDAESLWSSIESTASEIGGNISAEASDAWSQTKDYIKSNLQNAKAEAASMWSSMKSTVSSTVSNMNSAVSSKFSGIYSTINSKVNSAKSVINSGFESARSSMVSKMQSAMSTIKNQGWYGVGTNICTGIKNGLNAGWSWLKSTVSNLARNLLNSAKSALGIHSPSRLFRDAVGLNIGYGIGEGIEASEGSVLGSVVSVADAIAEEFNAGDYQAANIIPTTEINGKLMAFSDTITESFMALLDKLQAIAENVTFSVPVAASGLMPYATKGAVGSNNEDISELANVSTEKLITMLTQLITNQTAAIVAAIQTYCGTTVNLDADSLTTAIIDEINRRTKMTGQSPLLT